jgi:hypothetical protein
VLLGWWLWYLLLLWRWLVWLLLPLMGCHCSSQVSLDPGKKHLSQRNLGPDHGVVVLL